MNGTDPSGEFWGFVVGLVLSAIGAAIDSTGHANVSVGGEGGVSFGGSGGLARAGAGRNGGSDASMLNESNSARYRNWTEWQAAKWAHGSGASEAAVNGAVMTFTAGVAAATGDQEATATFQGDTADQRPPDTIHITGHRVGGVGPYHLAAEYRPSGGKATWISGHTPEEGIPVLSDLFGDPITSGVNHPADAPVNNITIGTVTPPPGVGAGEYWGSLLTASGACCGGLDYALFPSMFFDGYNSNSFLVGLIQATGGSPSVPLSGFVGGGHPIPPAYYGR